MAVSEKIVLMMAPDACECTTVCQPKLLQVTDEITKGRIQQSYEDDSELHNISAVKSLATSTEDDNVNDETKSVTFDGTRTEPMQDLREDDFVVDVYGKMLCQSNG